MFNSDFVKKKFCSAPSAALMPRPKLTPELAAYAVRNVMDPGLMARGSFSEKDWILEMG